MAPGWGRRTTVKRYILPLNITLALLLAAPLAYGGYLAYAPINEQDNYVRVVDGEYAQVVTDIHLSINPRYIATNGDGTRVYMASSEGSSLSVVDAVGNRVLHTVDSIGTSPGGIAVQPPLSGKNEQIYISTNEGVTIIDGATMTPSLLSVNYSGEGMAVSDNGRWLFVVGRDFAGKTGVSMVSIDGKPQQVASVELVLGANTVAVRDLSDLQYQTFIGNAGASTIDVVTWDITNISDVGVNKVQTIVLDGGSTPNDLALSGDGKTLFVANEGVQPLNQGETGSSGNLATIDTTTFDIQKIDLTGSFTGGYYGGVEIHPAAVAVSPGDDRLFVTKRVWYALNAGAYLSVLQSNGSGWNIISDIKLGNSSYGKGVFVGQECADCPRSFTPLAPSEPYTRPGAFGPYELAFLGFVALGLRRRRR